MIVRINKAGRSFAKLAKYLQEDTGGKKTSERVAWTHTLNCTNDHVPSAVHEMYNTWLDAELLKDEAGIKRGARCTRPVSHISLSWHPDEKPTREQMIEAAQSYLEHMGAGEHQAILAAHDDRPHPHVHIELNRVHPVSGATLSDSFEKERANEWRVTYEREHGRFLDRHNTLGDDPQRESVSRPSWRRYRSLEEEQNQLDDQQRQTSERQEAAEPRTDGEYWTKLKQEQREARESFFADGKSAYREVAWNVGRQVAKEFKGEWAEFYEARRAGIDPHILIDARSEIEDRQNALFKERAGEACTELRQLRDAEYSALLASQKIERARLTAFLAGDENTLTYFSDIAANENRAEPIPYAADTPHWEFREAAREVTQDIPEPQPDASDTRSFAENQNWQPQASGPRVRDGLDVGADIAGGVIGGLTGFSERLFDGFFGQPVTPRPDPSQAKTPSRRAEPSETPRTNPFAAVADEARRRAEQEAVDEKRRNDWWDERRARER